MKNEEEFEQRFVTLEQLSSFVKEDPKFVRAVCRKIKLYPINMDGYKVFDMPAYLQKSDEYFSKEQHRAIEQGELRSKHSKRAGKIAAKVTAKRRAERKLAQAEAEAKLKAKLGEDEMEKEETKVEETKVEETKVEKEQINVEKEETKVEQTKVEEEQINVEETKVEE